MSDNSFYTGMVNLRLLCVYEFSFKYKLYVDLKLITLIADDDDTSLKFNSFDSTNIDENSIEDSCKYYNLICVLEKKLTWLNIFISVLTLNFLSTLFVTNLKGNEDPVLLDPSKF